MSAFMVDQGTIYAKECYVGIDVTIEKDIIIGTPEKPIEKVVIGDHIFIGRGSDIRVRNLTIRDYTKINKNAFIYGKGDCYIGYNCWFGQNCILDCEGGIELRNGVGVGAYSQLWSHIRHGDTLIGNKYLSYGKLVAEDDVWFVGHVVVSPIIAKEKSMALVGSVVTRDMESNHIYGGSPAKDLTDKLGPPFEEISATDRILEMTNRLYNFYRDNPDIKNTGEIEIVAEIDLKRNTSQFDVVTRRYSKLNSPTEVAFMRHLLPTAKFIPNYAE